MASKRFESGDVPAATFVLLYELGATSVLGMHVRASELAHPKTLRAMASAGESGFESWGLRL